MTPKDAPYKLVQEQQRRRLKGRYKPPVGSTWNPMAKYPRNAQCICDSGKKFKKCCGLSTAPIVKLEDAQKMAEFVKMARAMR